MRSDLMKKGTSRIAHRALMKATGLTDEEISRPIIGVVNSQNEFIPGHIHLDTIAEAVEECLLSDPEFTKRISELETYDVEYSLSDQGARPAVVEILSFKLSYFQTYQPTITDDLNSVDIDVDVIDPIADPHPGPDGRIEFKVKANLQEDKNVRQTKSE